MSKTPEYEEGYVNANGYRIHYLQWGKSGRQIVALHSMGMDAHAFDTLCTSLVGRYRVLSLDLLGHGDSDTPAGPTDMEQHADIMRKVAVDRGFSKSVLIGHSIGGWLSMIYSAKYPEEVEKVILVDIAPRPLGAEARPMPARPMAPPPPDFFKDEDEALKYLKTRYSGFTDEALKNRLMYAFRRDAEGRLRLKTDPSRSEHLRGGFTYDFWPFIEKMRAPTLIIRGSQSTTVSDEAVEKMKQMMKNLKVVTIQGATHMVPQDCPKEFESAVRQFME